MAAPREIELKLEVPVEGLRKLEQNALLQGSHSPGKGADLVSVYFDTDKLDLRKGGVSLRVRQMDKRFLQTVKRNATGNGATLSRQEWETEISSKNPDIEAARRTPLGPLLTRKFWRSLKPIFETRVHRTVYAIQYDDSEIEVSLDEGHIEVGEKSSSIDEVELELKQGDSQALFRLASEIVKEVPATLGVESKADRGYGLVAGESCGPVKAFSVKLTPTESPQSAFQSIAWACLRQLCANTEPLLAGDAEALHQARVSIRRLLATISLFSELLRSKQTDDVKRELKWLIGEFGPAREAAVFTEGVVKPVAEGDREARGVSKLRDYVVEKRNCEFRRAQSAIETVRFRVLELEVAAWIETGEWKHPNDARGDLSAKGTIAETATAQLNRYWKKLVRRGKHIDTLNPQDRHKLRIAAKKLRYASEFFADVFPGKRVARRRKRFLAALKTLLANLGNLNDITVNKRLSASLIPMLVAGLHDPAWEAFTAGRMCGREEGRFSSVIKAAMRAHKVFASARRFWI